jgi:hypothetical protein
MPSHNRITKGPLEESMISSYDSLLKAVGPQKLRSILLGAKASLLGKSSLSKAARLQQLLIHRRVEKKLFGEIQSLPGEEDLLKDAQSEKPPQGERHGLPQQVDELFHLGTEKVSPRVVGPQALTDELRKREVNEPTLTIAGLILAVAITSAEQIERGFREKASKSGKFKDEDFQDIVAEFTYVFLHFGTTLPMTDGHPIPSFTHREERMQPGIVVETDGMHLLNERQAEYSRFKLFAAQEEPQLSDTLFWEFGNHVLKIAERYEPSPFVQFEAKLVAEAAYKELIPVFGKMMHEPPRKPVGFLRRLFRRRA